MSNVKRRSGTTVRAPAAEVLDGLARTAHRVREREPRSRPTIFQTEDAKEGPQGVRREAQAQLAGRSEPTATPSTRAAPCLIGVGQQHVASRRGRRRRRARAARDVGGGRPRRGRRQRASAARPARPTRRARDRVLPDLAVRRPDGPARGAARASSRAHATTRASAARRRRCWCRTPRSGSSRGELDVALVVRRRGARHPAAVQGAAGSATRTASSPRSKRPFPWEAPFHPAEVAHEVFQAWLTFAIFDNARRGHLGSALDEYRRRAR